MKINMRMTENDFEEIKAVNEGDTVALHLFYEDEEGVEHEVEITSFWEDNDDE